MTKAQIDDAIKQAQSSAQLLESQWKEGSREYGNVSVREVLYELGFEEDQADEVIRVIAARGFSHCLDPIVKTRTDDGSDGYCPPWACAWGFDQLRSRLDCVR